MPGFDDLTPDQDKILRLPDEGRYLVYGPPGTGKTIIALMRAVAMRERGNQPVTIMFNRLLNLYCRQMLGQGGSYAPVFTYHQWFCQHFGSLYRERPPERVDEQGNTLKFRYDWGKVIQTCAAQTQIKTDPTPLLIDEGQDLPRQFYEYLSLHFPNIMVFADENQMLDDEENCILKDICNQLGISHKLDPQTKAIMPDNEHTFLLRDNMRNTQQIARVAEHFYTGTQSGKPDLPVRDGPKPYLIDHNDLSFFAERIVRHSRIHPQYLIAVITSDNSSWEAIRQLIEPLCSEQGLHFACYNSQVKKPIDFNNAGIVLLNLQSMKGLEFDSVLVADLHRHSVRTNSAEHKMRMYVASSRPRERLYLFHDRNQRSPILDDMPGEDVLGRYSLSREGASG
jgi:superfamily I DNA/RNA helicase